MKDKNKFAALMTAMGEIFDRDVSRSLIKAYASTLLGYTDDEITAGFKLAIREAKFFPKPYEVIEFIEKAKPDHVVLDERALESSLNILMHLRQHGGSKSYVTADPIAKYLMETRWPYRRWASEVLESELKWWQKEYIEAYKTLYQSREMDLATQIPERAKKLLTNIGKLPDMDA